MILFSIKNEIGLSESSDESGTFQKRGLLMFLVKEKVGHIVKYSCNDNQK